MKLQSTNKGFRMLWYETISQIGGDKRGLLSTVDKIYKKYLISRKKRSEESIQDVAMYILQNIPSDDPILHSFRGNYKTIDQCMKCNSAKPTDVVFTSLSLEIVDHFVGRPELINEICPTCKETEVKRELRIQYLSQRLCLR